MRFQFAALAVSFIATPLLLAAPNSKTLPNSEQVVTWSRSAQPLPHAINPDPALRHARISSPNGKYEITCSSTQKENRLSESVSEMQQASSCDLVAEGKRVPIDLEVGPEALWSPDSDAVAVTHSRGGALGTYQVLIYRPEKSGPTDISTAVRKDLARRFPACVGERAGCTAAQRKAMRRNVQWVNVAAIRWMDGSNRLLMMAWVPDSSEFGANFGKLSGYVVDARDGHILSRYSHEEFKRRFKTYCGNWGL
jgi:hypothetical protein